MAQMEIFKILGSSYSFGDSVVTAFDLSSFWSAAEEFSSNHFAKSHKTSLVDPLSDDPDS